MLFFYFLLNSEVAKPFFSSSQLLSRLTLVISFDFQLLNYFRSLTYCLRFTSSSLILEPPKAIPFSIFSSLLSNSIFSYSASLLKMSILILCSFSRFLPSFSMTTLSKAVICLLSIFIFMLSFSSFEGSRIASFSNFLSIQRFSSFFFLYNWQRSLSCYSVSAFQFIY